MDPSLFKGFFCRQSLSTGSRPRASDPSRSKGCSCRQDLPRSCIWLSTRCCFGPVFPCFLPFPVQTGFAGSSSPPPAPLLEFGRSCSAGLFWGSTTVLTASGCSDSANSKLRAPVLSSSEQESAHAHRRFGPKNSLEMDAPAGSTALYRRQMTGNGVGGSPVSGLF